jgi:hypothetical protein
LLALLLALSSLKFQSDVYGGRLGVVAVIRLTGYVQPEVEVIRTLRLGSFWCLI